MTKRRLSEQHALGAWGSGPRTSGLDTGYPGTHSALDSRASFPSYSACGVGGCTGHPPQSPLGNTVPQYLGHLPAFATWARRLPGQVGWTARGGGVCGPWGGVGGGDMSLPQGGPGLHQEHTPKTTRWEHGGHRRAHGQRGPLELVGATWTQPLPSGSHMQRVPMAPENLQSSAAEPQGSVP